MADQNHSTIDASLQGAQDAFSDISDMLLGADTLIAQHQDADGELLAVARNLIRLVREAAATAGNAADRTLVTT